MSKARDLANFISTGVGTGILADGAIDTTEVTVSGSTDTVQQRLDGLRTDIDGLGTAAALDVGTGANNVVQLNAEGKLPEIDGSGLTGIQSGAAAYIVPDVSLANYVFKQKEIVPNELTISGTWQGIDDDAVLYISYATPIASNGEYFEEDTTLSGNHVSYATVRIADAATVTINNGITLHAFAGVLAAGAADTSDTDQYQSTGRVVYFGDT